jgi:hypothetical protein
MHAPAPRAGAGHKADRRFVHDGKGHRGALAGGAAAHLDCYRIDS